MKTSLLQAFTALLFTVLSCPVFSQNVPASAVGRYLISGTVSPAFATQYGTATVNAGIDLSQDGTVSVSLSSTNSVNAGVNGCAFTAKLTTPPVPPSSNVTYTGIGSATMAGCSETRLNTQFSVSLTVYSAGGMSLTGTGFSANDFIGLSFATPGGGTPSITPTSGIWWNPNESGSGYALEVQHGVLAILIFSYQTNGSPQWYYVTGPMNGNSFTGTLDKYTGGPCISCPYVGRPALAGNDGSITIQFSSTTTGTLTANGRTTTIQYMTY